MEFLILAEQLSKKGSSYVQKSSVKVLVSVDTLKVKDGGFCGIPMKKVKEKDLFHLTASFEGKNETIEVPATSLEHDLSGRLKLDEYVNSNDSPIKFSFTFSRKKKAAKAVVIQDISKLNLTDRIQVDIDDYATIILRAGLYNPSTLPLIHTPFGKMGAVTFFTERYQDKKSQGKNLIPKNAFGDIRDFNTSLVVDWLNKYEDYAEVTNITKHSGLGTVNSAYGNSFGTTYKERVSAYVETVIFFRRKPVEFVEEKMGGVQKQKENWKEEEGGD